MNTQQKLEAAKAKIAAALADIAEVAEALKSLPEDKEPLKTNGTIGYIYNASISLTTATEFTEAAIARLN